MLQKLKKDFSKTVRNSFLYFKYLYYVKDELIKNNIQNIKIFNFLSWHHNFIYLIAHFNTKKVFIKIDLKYGVVLNESIIRRHLKNKLSCIQVLKCIETNNFSCVIFDFIEYKTLDDLIYDSSIIKYLNQALNQISILNENKIIHRDIKLDNFLLYNGKIVLNDFVFATSKNRFIVSDLKKITDLKLEKKVLADLGLYKPSKYEWNDFYSFTEILKKLKNLKHLNSNEIQKLINKSLKMHNKYTYNF